MLRVRLDGGEMYAKQGSMVAYRGQMDFAYKGQGVGGFLRRAVSGEGQDLMRVRGRGIVWFAEWAATSRCSTSTATGSPSTGATCWRSSRGCAIRSRPPAAAWPRWAPAACSTPRSPATAASACSASAARWCCRPMSRYAWTGTPRSPGLPACGPGRLLVQAWQPHRPQLRRAGADRVHRPGRVRRRAVRRDPGARHRPALEPARRSSRRGPAPSATARP